MKYTKIPQQTQSAVKPCYFTTPNPQHYKETYKPK